MNLTISGHHLEVTPALREYVLTKLDRVTRHFDQVVDITVLLSIEKLKEKERRQKAEVTLRVKGKDIFVETSHEDLYAAVDQLMDKLDRQVVRHKDRLQDHHHQADDQAHGGEPDERLADHVLAMRNQRDMHRITPSCISHAAAGGSPRPPC